MIASSLIPVADRKIGGELTQTVNARDLHAFLGNKDNFTTWVIDRISQYRFLEGIDFISFLESTKKPTGGRPAKEYAITLDMAKELAMVERNERGRQARQYFIDCERRAHAIPPLTLDDPASLRAALLGYTEKVLSLQATVDEQTPKVNFYDAVTDASNCQTMDEVAKVLGTGRNRLYSLLRDEKILMANNLPYQAHIDNDHFRVIEGQYLDGDGESRTYTKTLVTGRGLSYIHKRLFSKELAV